MHPNHMEFSGKKHFNKNDYIQFQVQLKLNTVPAFIHTEAIKSMVFNYNSNITQKEKKKLCSFQCFNELAAHHIKGKGSQYTTAEHQVHYIIIIASYERGNVSTIIAVHKLIFMKIVNTFM